MELRSLMNLSERNTKFTLCNSFFFDILIESFPGVQPIQFETLGATTLSSPPRAFPRVNNLVLTIGREKNGPPASR
jgi:hypothetical protein